MLKCCFLLLKCHLVQFQEAEINKQGRFHMGVLDFLCAWLWLCKRYRNIANSIAVDINEFYTIFIFVQFLPDIRTRKNESRLIAVINISLFWKWNLVYPKYWNWSLRIGSHESWESTSENRLRLNNRNLTGFYSRCEFKLNRLDKIFAIFLFLDHKFYDCGMFKSA